MKKLSLTTLTLSLSLWLSSSALAVTKNTIDAALDLSKPSRYAFVTDDRDASMAVVDTYTNTHVGVMPLQAVADNVVTSQATKQLFYALNGDTTVYQVDLASQAQKPIKTEHPLNHLVIDESSQWLVYSSDNAVYFKSLKTGKEQLLVNADDTSIVYNSTIQQLFVAELQIGQLHRISIQNDTIAAQDVLFTRDTPMSAISLMPNGIALFFIANSQLYRYSLLDEELSTIALNAPLTMVRPYMTSDGRMLFALAKQQESQPATLLAINAYTYKVKSRHTLPQWSFSTQTQRDFMRTGWLEKVAALAGDESFYTFTIKDEQNLKKQPVATQVIDFIVKSDSKTLLFTQKDNNYLGVMDLKEQRISAEVVLPLKSPRLVIMTETNTLCH